MPQTSQPYAIGRVRALSRTLITRPVLERLRAAEDVAQICRVLSECGWGEARTQAELDALADRQVADACALVREITPDPDVTDCFLLRYDVLNLKTLLKSRMLGQREVRLSPNGTLDPERLRHAVTEANYRDVPEEMREALEQIEERIAVENDPLFVDARLDRLLFEMTDARVRRARPQECVRAYFAARADAANMMTALRLGRMGRGAELLAELFVPGGALRREELEPVVSDAQALVPLARARLEPEFAHTVERALESLTRAGSLALMEKRLDDYMLALLRPGRFDVLGVAPVVGYLLAREREAAAVRLLAAARAVNASPELLENTLRQTYA